MELTSCHAGGVAGAWSELNIDDLPRVACAEVVTHPVARGISSIIESIEVSVESGLASAGGVVAIAAVGADNGAGNLHHFVSRYFACVAGLAFTYDVRGGDVVGVCVSRCFGVNISGGSSGGDVRIIPIDVERICIRHRTPRECCFISVAPYGGEVGGGRGLGGWSSYGAFETNVIEDGGVGGRDAAGAGGHADVVGLGHRDGSGFQLVPCDAVAAQESGEFVAHAADAHPQRCTTIVGAIGPGGAAARRGAHAGTQHPVALLTEGDAHALSPWRQCAAHLYAHLVKNFDGRDEAHGQRCIA